MAEEEEEEEEEDLFGGGGRIRAVLTVRVESSGGAILRRIRPRLHKLLLYLSAQLFNAHIESIPLFGKGG